MSDKLIVVLVNADPDNIIEVSMPIIQATVAASMEYEVELIFSGRAGKLAIKGNAEQIVDEQHDDRSVLDLIKDAYEAGVTLKVCTPALELWGDELISEINEIVGGTYIISEAMDDDTVTFTY